MLFQFLAHLLGIEDINVKLLDVFTYLSYFLLQLKRELLLELELEEDDGVRLLVLYQEGKEYLLLLAMAIHRVYRIVERRLDDFFKYCEVIVINQDWSSSKDREVMPINRENSLDSAKFVFDVNLMKDVIFFIGRILQQVAILIAKNNHIHLPFFIGIDVFYALKAFNGKYSDHVQCVSIQDSQVRLVESNINMRLIGRDGTNFDVLMIEVILE